MWESPDQSGCYTHTHTQTHVRTKTAEYHTQRSTMISSARCHGNVDTACTPAPQSAELSFMVFNEGLFLNILFFFFVMEMKYVKLESICGESH